VSDRLKVGVVGGGVGRMHIDAFRELPDRYEVAAFCDIDAERARAIAAELGIGKAVFGLDALLELELDVIDLCTPSSLHFAQSLEVLRAGRHLIVEKPLASSLAEIERLRAAEAAAGKRVCPIFQYRFGHGIQKLHHLAAKGVTGRPSVATAETHWRRTAAYYAAGPWRGRWSTELGGCLTTHAIHIHDLLLQVLGPLRRVYARAARRLNRNETEDMAALALEFASGALATSSVTLGSHPEISRLRFCFEGLTAESGLAPYNPGHEPWRFMHDDAAGQERIDRALDDFAPLPERFVGLFLRLHNALAGDAPLPVTIDDAARSIELLSAAYYSVLTGAAVELPIPPAHPFYGGWAAAMRQDLGDG
jgi:predicted dehydrogenase